MFFLLRSIFWLTIVFTSMSWTVDEMRPGPHPGSHALGEAIAEGGSAMASAARQAALARIGTQMADGAGDQAKQLLENAALSYLAGGGSVQAVPVQGVQSQAVSNRARVWCTATDDVCARDAARLTALIAANQSDEADEAASGSSLLPLAPRRRATVRVPAHKNS